MMKKLVLLCIALCPMALFGELLPQSAYSVPDVKLEIPKNTGVDESKIQVDPDKVLFFEVDGMKFYLKRLDWFETLLNYLRNGRHDACFSYNSPDGTVTKDIGDLTVVDFLASLYDSCNDNMLKYEALVQENGYDPVGSYTSKGAKLDRKIDNFWDREVTHRWSAEWSKQGRKAFLQKMLSGCLIHTEKVKQQIQLLKARDKDDNPLKTTTVPITAEDIGNIYSCLQSVQRLPEADHLWYADNSSYSSTSLDTVCDQEAFLEDKIVEKIANSRGLISSTLPSEVAFDYAADVNKDSIFVYLHGALVHCNYGIADKLVYPVYSGREMCQSDKYTKSTEVGGVPRGVYLVRERDVRPRPGETPAFKQEIWGKYRVMLIPATYVDTGGRNSMYLHGRGIDSKIPERRSAGCLNVGWHSEEMVHDLVTKDSLVIVVSQNEIPAKACTPWANKKK